MRYVNLIFRRMVWYMVCLNTRGRKIAFLLKSSFIAEMIRDRPISCYGSLIGSHRSICVTFDDVERRDAVDQCFPTDLRGPYICSYRLTDTIAFDMLTQVGGAYLYGISPVRPRRRGWGPTFLHFGAPNYVHTAWSRTTNSKLTCIGERRVARGPAPTLSWSGLSGPKVLEPTPITFDIEQPNSAQ